MPEKLGLAKTYYTLREAFDLVGTEIFGTEWQGFEADLDPARKMQQTDSRTLLRKLAPDGLSFTEERLPVPPRPIDNDDGAKLEQAIERHVKALKELLYFLHNGCLPADFIAEDETTKKDSITASKWPDPAEFDPKNPTWNNLWFDIAADRVVLKSPGTSPIPGRARGDGSLWWAYGGRMGHVEIGKEALEKALMAPDLKGGTTTPLAEGPQSDAETPETRREKQARETQEKYKRWYDRAQEIKEEGSWTRPTEIARAIAKREKGSGERGVNAANIKRRLDEYYSGWSERARRNKRTQNK